MEVDAAASRRKELLHIARRSRIKWVLSAKEIDHANVELRIGKGLPVVSASLHEKIPASVSIQNVLNYLSEIVADGDAYDINAISAGMIDSDAYDDDASASSTSYPPSSGNDDYNDFIEKLTRPAATEIVKSMQQFATKFCTDFSTARGTTPSTATLGSYDDDEEFQNWSGRIWSFLDHVYETMRQSPIWARSTESQFSASEVHCEKFIFTKLHYVLFASDTDDVALNAQTAERIESLSFLRAEHLDIKCIRALHELYLAKMQAEAMTNGSRKPVEYVAAQDSRFLSVLLEQPMRSLTEMSTAKCPQDMLLCVKRCTMEIAAILKSCRTDGSLPGADELLPMMIYAIRCCNPVRLHSTLKYLQRYTRPSQLIAEAGYLLTNFVSGVFFLDNVDAKALTIEPEEFDRAILQSKMKAKASKDVILKQHMAKRALGAKSTEEGEKSESAKVDVDKLLAEYKKSVLALRGDSLSVKDIHSRRKSGRTAAGNG